MHNYNTIKELIYKMFSDVMINVLSCVIIELLGHSDAVYGVCFRQEEQEIFASASEVRTNQP